MIVTTPEAIDTTAIENAMRALETIPDARDRADALDALVQAAVGYRQKCIDPLSDLLFMKPRELHALAETVDQVIWW